MLRLHAVQEEREGKLGFKPTTLECTCMLPFQLGLLVAELSGSVCESLLRLLSLVSLTL